MQRYYLHIHNGLGHTPDEEGQLLANLGAACEAATRGARSIMSGEVLKGRIDLTGRIEIVDEQGALLDTVPYTQAVQVDCGDGA